MKSQITNGGWVLTKMRNLRRNQRGFTLIELLIAFLLTGIVASAITGMVLYVFNANFTTANHMAAVRQVRNVGFWVTPDGQMAKNVTTGGTSGFPLTLTWKEWDTNDSHDIIYSLEDMSSSGFKVLKREHYIESSLDSIIIVAEYIDPAETDCDFSGDVITFTVTANVGGQIENRVYEVKRRPLSQ